MVQTTQKGTNEWWNGSGKKQKNDGMVHLNSFSFGHGPHWIDTKGIIFH